MVIDPITNEYYIGSRTCKCEPNMDVYMGSPVSWKPIDKSRLKKIIIKSDFKNRNNAIMLESQLIKENINNKLNRNYHIPGIGFITTGQVTVNDKNGNTFNVDKADPKYISGEYIATWVGRTHSIDSRKKMSKSKKGKPNKNKGKIGIYSIETLEKMRMAALNRKPVSNITRKKISESLKGKMIGINNPMYGKTGSKNPNYGNKWTDEQKIAQSEKRKGHNKTPKKSILQYSLDGVFIKEWDGLIDAAKSLNLNIGGIGNCLANRYKHCGGFIWKYKTINYI